MYDLGAVVAKLLIHRLQGPKDVEPGRKETMLEAALIVRESCARPPLLPAASGVCPRYQRRILAEDTGSKALV
jgi:hypothetical protein